MSWRVRSGHSVADTGRICDNSVLGGTVSYHGQSDWATVPVVLYTDGDRCPSLCSRLGNVADETIPRKVRGSVVTDQQQPATVVNLKTHLFDVLIDNTTIFGNPYPEDGAGGREECVRRHSIYFYRRLDQDPEFKERVLKLQGKVLGCWCKPSPCHGDTIAEYLNACEWLERIKKEAKQ